MSIDYFFNSFADRLAQEFPSLKTDLNGAFASKVRDLWWDSLASAKFIPGALESLHALRSGEMKTVLVTNTTPPTRRLIDELGLPQYFDALILSCDVGYTKPEVPIFNAALEAVNSSPEESIMCGDKIATDMVGCAAAGIKGIYIDSQLARYDIYSSSANIVASVPSIIYVPRIVQLLNGVEPAKNYSVEVEREFPS